MANRSHAPLIRLARFKVEELQKQMAEIERARASIGGQIARLEQSVPEEQAVAAEDKDGYLAYGSYARSVIQRKDNLRASLDEVAGQADALRTRLEDAFAELKKYELLGRAPPGAHSGQPARGRTSGNGRDRRARCGARRINQNTHH
jgi:flagellar FliJ protein